MICGNCRGGEASPELSCRPCLLSSHRSPRQSTVPNGDRRLTTPIRLKATIPSPLQRPPRLLFPFLPLPSRLQAMTALPSFVELMATLGLDNKSSPSPTQEFSSPAIVVSSEHEPTQDHISSRIRVARYSPYGAPIVSLSTRTRSNRSSLQPAPQSHSHRRSASTLSSDGTDSELPNRVCFRDPMSFFWSLTPP